MRITVPPRLRGALEQVLAAVSRPEPAARAGAAPASAVAGEAGTARALPGEAGEPARRLPAGLWAVFLKEVGDHVTSWRFIILTVLVVVTGLAATYVASQTIRGAVSASEAPDFVFLRLFTASDGRLYPFTAFVGFLGPLLGLALGFDAISGEFNRRTMSRLLAQPIHRDAVIHGKFLAGVVTVAGMLLALLLVVAGMGLSMIGVPPSGEEVARLLLFFLVTVVYVAFWLALSILFSILFRQTATSALAGIAVWLFFAVFGGLLAELIASSLVPANQDSPPEVVLRQLLLRQALGRISPAVLYDEAVATLLSPSVRTLSPVMLEQVVGAIQGNLPLMQSVLLIWPHITGLVAATMICFAISYVLFMRREIRA